MEKKMKHKKNQNLIDWYDDVLISSEMVDFSEIKGFAVYRPYGYTMWELLQKELDKEFKSLGVQNTYFPLLIPEKLLMKEKKHVEGFAPEVAWVTMGGDRKLDERLAIRPTSETIMYDSYSRWIKSYRDLPLLLNQWNTMVRWETKETRFLLRGRENIWQEGHCVFASEEEANRNAMDALEIYRRFMEDVLAVPVLAGKKSEMEKFAGAVTTYTVEAVLPNNFLSQAATSHYLGQNFSKAFEIKFVDAKNDWRYAHQTSWGISMRSVGIMTLVHGDDNGLILPPKIAPIQVIIIPISGNGGKGKEILNYAKRVENELIGLGIRSKIDTREEYTSGWKFNEYDLKGIPIRIDVGERELSTNGMALKLRYNGEKRTLAFKDIKNILQLLDEIQNSMFEKAKEDAEKRIIEMGKDGDTVQSIFKVIKEAKFVVKAPFCGEEACEAKIKEATGATSRVISIIKEKLINDRCIFCGNEARSNAYFAQSY